MTKYLWEGDHNTQLPLRKAACCSIWDQAMPETVQQQAVLRLSWVQPAGCNGCRVALVWAWAQHTEWH